MWGKLKKYFLSGLVVFLPTALTVYLFIATLNVADSLLGKYIQPYFIKWFGFYFHGLGIILIVYVLLLIGFFASNFFGKRIYEAFERLLIRVPFFKQVYPAIKEMAMFLFTRDRVSQFKQVVIVEYPRKGIYSFGFLTNESSEKLKELTKQDVFNVFVPSAPGPLTGFVMMIPRKDIIFTDVGVEQAFKFILSGGVVNPR